MQRLWFLVGASMALFLLMAAPASALSGFSNISRFGASIDVDKVVKLCPKVMHVAGITLTVPRPCKNVAPPPVQPQLVFSANPTTIVVGNSAMLVWDSTDATSCTASGGWNGAKALDGSESVSPTATTNYVLTCFNGANSVVKNVTVTVNPVTPTTATLTLVKTVIKNNGGTAVAADFQAKIDGNNVPWGVAQTLTPGAHTASEVAVTGYTASAWGTDCAADGTITLAAGESKTCTITNDDQAGTLMVKKVIINDNGGSTATTTFSFQVNGGASTAFEADAENAMTVDAGTYTVTEVAATGYATTYSNCSNVIISNGETETCTITNDDIAVAPTTATLTLVKNLVKNNGGTANATDWTLTADGPTDISGITGSAAVTNAIVTPGAYALSESAGPAGYTASEYSCVKNSGGAVSGNSLTLAAGDSATCTITNDDQSGTLIVKKVIVNDNGGTAATSTFMFQVDGGTATAFESDGQNDLTVNAGTYTVTEVAASGYTTTYENCAAVVVGNGGSATCTITNNDVPTSSGNLLITEVLYDLSTSTPPQGVESANEWVELHNGTGATLDLSGYTIHDDTGSDVLPQGTTLAAGGFMIITATSTTASFYSFPVGTVVVVLGNNIGSNGLANAGERVEIRNGQGASVDAVSWGSDTFAFSPSVPLVEANTGHSIARKDVHVDTGAAADWEELNTPTPGL